MARRHSTRRTPSGLDTAGFFVLRTPLLPVDVLTEVDGRTVPLRADEVQAEGPAASDLAERLRGARQCTRDWLEALLQRPEVQEALRLASPSLLEGLGNWRRDPDSKKGRRAEAALLRYVQRMAARPTPFGLFAGTSVGELASPTRRPSPRDAGTDDAPQTPTTHLELPPQAAYRRHTRLDNDVLFDLGERLLADPAVRRGLILRPNSSLYRKGETWRYAEAQRQGTRRVFQLVSVAASPSLDAVLAAAAPGVTVEVLRRLLVDSGDGEIDSDDALEFIHTLIDSELLSAELMPNVTGLPPLAAMARRLRGLEGLAGRVAAALGDAEGRCAELDRQGLTAGGEATVYDDLVGELHGVFGTSAAEGAAADGSAAEGAAADRTAARSSIQVDLSKPGGNLRLGSQVAEALCRGVEVLARLRPPREDGLDEFRRAFGERYGEGRLVPLHDVLDVDLGLGFPVGAGRRRDASPLVARLPFSGTGGGTPTVPWGARDKLLLDRLQAVLAAGETTLRLDDDDLQSLPEVPAASLPDSLQVMATLAATDAEAVERGDFKLLVNGFHGPSGARLLGRFCHTDSQLQDHVQQLVEDEEALQPSAAFAEVVHLPQGRLGNVTWRPRLRRHEIVFLGRGGADGDDRLTVDDLQVTVDQGTIRLWSERLGREVVPRLTNAHNYLQGQLPAYHFLCALQQQGLTGSGVFSWGALQHSAFLPRVTYGRLVLSRASWRLDGDDLEALAVDDDGARFLALQRWRSRRAVPRYVVLQDADNELLVDLDDPAVVDAFLAAVRKRRQVRLVELYPAPHDNPVRGPEGGFRHELVVPLRRRREPSPPWTPARSGSLTRQFAPGSEWLYAKIYTDPATADEVLRQAVLPTVREMQGAGVLQGWFFLRFADPERHLRVRFRGQPAALLSDVLPALRRRLQPLLECGRVHRLQLDTYERELERYGGDLAMESAEALFHADSEVAGRLVALAGDDAEKRWQWTLLGLDVLVRDLGLSADEQGELWHHLSRGFSREFGDSKALKQFLAQRLRQHRRPLETLLDAKLEDPRRPAAERILEGRRGAARAMGELARRLDAEGHLTTSWQRLVGSFAHMFVNRMIRAESRAHEVVLYDLLDRLHRSRQARRRAGRQAERRREAVA